jgi:cyclophilin family peptidyl-prolyl cis-trans isomerase
VKERKRGSTSRSGRGLRNASGARSKTDDGARREAVITLALLGAAVGVIIGIAIIYAVVHARGSQPIASAPPATPPSPVTVPKLTACGENPPTTETAKVPIGSPPKMTVSTSARYVATLRTSCGIIKVRLTPAQSPVAVNNFLFLANKAQWYDGLLFHNIDKRGGYVVTGDAGCTNNVGGANPPNPICGRGDAGYTVNAPPAVPQKVVPGSVVMKDMGKKYRVGSQFYVVTSSQGARLPDASVVIGHLEGSSMRAIKRILAIPTVGPGGIWPKYRVWIYSASVRKIG